MSVDVDYGSGHVIYSVEASEAYTAPTSALVQGRGDDVYGYLQLMGDSADISAAEALVRIDALKSFQASVRSVTFDAPEAVYSTLNPVTGCDPILVTGPRASTLPSSLDTNFRYNLEDSISGGAGSWDTPPAVVYEAPTAPGLSPGLPLPSEVGDYTMPPISVPVLVTPEYIAANIPVPSLVDVDIVLADLVTIEDFEIDVDTSALLAAIEAMKAFDVQVPVLPEYLYLIPEVFSVTGSMASGNTIVNYTQLLASRNGLLSSTRPSVANAFSRRSLLVPDGSSAYDQWLEGALGSKMDDSDTVFTAAAVDEVVRTAFQLGTAAHRMLVDIETALYTLEFDLAKAEVGLKVEKSNAIGEIYKGEVVLLQNEIAQYNAVAARVVANAKVFEANAQQAGVVGELNSVTADLFATTEGIKVIDAEVFKALVDAESAKLVKYKAVIDSYKSYVATADAAVAAYSGKTAKYAAEVEKISTQYATYATQAQSIQFENSARATTLGALGSEIRALAATADSSAAKASAKSIELMAKASVRETTYIKRALGNDEDGTRFRITGSEYDEELSNYAVNLIKRGAYIAGTGDTAGLVARYLQTAQESIGRAAALSQTANIQLGRTYAGVYEAAGRAGAAVASGKLSGFRASANMSAGDSLNSSNTYGVGYSGSGTNSFSETDNERGV